MALTTKVQGVLGFLFVVWILHWVAKSMSALKYECKKAVAHY